MGIITGSVFLVVQRIRLGSSGRNLLHQAEAESLDESVEGCGRQFRVAGPKVGQQSRVDSDLGSQFLDRSSGKGDRPAHVAEEPSLLSGRLDLAKVRDVLLFAGQLLLDGGLPFGLLLRRKAQCHSLLASGFRLPDLLLLFRRQLSHHSLIISTRRQELHRVGDHVAAGALV